ncbi:uncharacterized protein LOC143028110 [Oratosquilla oratoria]|uniref:uncharacterized protein LOC143028110 n=1 Tax=Oratosquilla oratoria TaxID=337810 RepID=UPI003F75EC81
MTKQCKPGTTKEMKNNRLSPAMFYSSLYMEREGFFNHITKSRRLFQQFVVDNYVKMESNKLTYFELNQSQIRKERADILNCTNKGSDTGQRVVLPASFIGGPRYMKERQQDALAYVTYYGSPDYFITFTVNPKCLELREAMNDTGSASTRCLGDRPDLVSRIFKLKVDSLMKDLTHGKIFGQVKANLYSIEWQKRGLPHAHILLWMDDRVTADTVSQFISAEIPDKNEEPRLYDVVTRCMIHGPCKGYDESQPCCQGKNASFGKCGGKKFPKTCRSDLLFGNNGYPEYKRRSIGEGGNSFKVTIKKEEKVIDNSWVVPYNPYLCLKYNAHINVECSNSIKCIAYVTKYVNKGCDRILFVNSIDGETVNKVKNFQEARFINANEATWKIFKFEIHKSYPPVMTLDLHLEGENEIFYDERSSERELEKRARKDTQLTVFFKLCSRNTFAASLLYHELPHHFVYNAKCLCWEERQGPTFSLGRIRAVTTTTVELFYLRLLLTHKPGPTSYEDLRTIEGVMHPSYREAVKALGLSSDEETWKMTILEIINHTNDRYRLRETYASMLVFSDLEDQSRIWEETKDLFASDFLHTNNLTEYNDEIYLDALDDIQKQVWNCGGGSITDYGLPPSRGGEKTSNVIRREKLYNKKRLKDDVNVKEPMLDDKQKQIYDTAMFRVEHGHRYDNNGIFVNAAGGTGKSPNISHQTRTNTWVLNECVKVAERQTKGRRLAYQMTPNSDTTILKTFDIENRDSILDQHLSRAAMDPLKNVQSKVLRLILACQISTKIANMQQDLLPFIVEGIYANAT